MKTRDSIYATIIIPTYNGEKYIGDILAILFRQDVVFKYEVLIIDSGSTDKTLEVIAEYKKRYNNLRLHQIPNEQFGHGKTRNQAAQLAEGEIVVYLSHDAIPAHDEWLYEMIKPFSISDKIVGVMGKQDPRPGCQPILKYEIQSVFRNLGPDFGTTIFYNDTFIKDEGVRDAVSFYSDVNSAARRDFLVNTIPYQDVRYAEDQLFGQDLIEAGYYKAYAPRGNVIHSNDLTLREYKHRLFDETMGLRKIGRANAPPSVGVAMRQAVTGSLRDAFRILKDPAISWKRKVYWFVINPLYHIEKWRGIRRAYKVSLHDTRSYIKHSLEERRKDG